MVAYKKIQRVKGTPNISGSDLRNLKDGSDSKQFKAFLDEIGINKTTFLETARSNPDLIERIQNSFTALESYRGMANIAKEWYKNNKQEITLLQELQRLELQIAKFLKRQEDDPEYSPIQDKQYLKAVELKMKLMEAINKNNIDVGKLHLDSVSKGAVTEGDIVWDSEQDE